MQKQGERLILCDTVHKEGTAQYLLCDYEQDVKRILCCRAKEVKGSTYRDGDTCVAIGSVEFALVYENAEGGISGSSFFAEYEIPLAVKGELYDCRVELLGSSVRPVSPRKLMGKYTLVARAFARHEEGYEPEGDAMEREGTVTRCKRVQASHYAFVQGEEREYAEELCRSEREGTYLYTDADATVEKVEIVHGGVVVGGTIHLSTLVRRDEGAVECVNGRIPFEEFVLCEEAEEGCEVIGLASVVSVRIDERREDDAAVSVASLICRFGVHLLARDWGELVEDLYSTEYRTEIERHMVEYLACEHLCRLHLPVEIRVAREETECPFVESVLLCTSGLRSAVVSVHEGHVDLEAELSVCLVGEGMREQGNAEYGRHTEKYAITSSASTALATEGMTFSPIRATPRVSASVEENELVFAGSVEVVGYLGRSATADAVTHANCTEQTPTPMEDDEVWILYPEKSLWEIAKENRLSPQKLCRDNNIELSEELIRSDDPIKGASYLWVEK